MLGVNLKLGRSIHKGFLARLRGSVAALYRGGAKGIYLDISDRSTLFQDAAGTTPANSPGDPVALVLDKSEGLVLGPELVTNGSFDTGDLTGWIKVGEDATHTVTYSNGGARYQSDTTSPALYFRQNGILETGKLYRFEIETTTLTSGSLKIDNLEGGTINVTPAVGTTVFFGIPTSNDLVMYRNTSNVDVTIDNISVRELPGHHAYQTINNDKRPTLQQDGGGLWYLDFDGVDDFLETSAIDFTGTDKMSVFAGVHKASDAAIGTVCELSASYFGNDGSFVMAAPTSVADNYQFATKGTVAVGVTGTGFAAPTTDVLAGLGDISGDSVTLRVNGVIAASSSSDLGLGNYGNHKLYIGARAGISRFFNGRLYGLTVVGKQTTAAEIDNTERYLAGKSGVTL